MKFKSTWILFLLVLLLGSYAYFGEYKKELDDQKKKEEETTLVNSKVDQISSLILLTAKEKIILARGPEGWKLEEPVKDWAESETVDSFVNGLVEEKYLEVAKEGDGINWADYGLDRPEAKLTLKSQGGQETLIEISGKKNFEGNALLRLNSQNKVLIANSSWIDRSTKAAFEFRQKNLLRPKAASIDKVTLKSAKNFVSLENKDGQWVLTGAPKKVLDQNKVRALVTSFNETKAVEILSEAKLSAADLKKYSLDRPQIEIEVDMKGKIWKGQISQDSAKLVYALTTEPQMLLKLDAAAFDKFQRVSVFNLRDHTIPFQVPQGDIKSLELLEGLKKTEVPSDQIQDLVEKVRKTQVEGFVESAPNFKPASSLSLKDGSGKELFRLDWMAAKKTKIDGVEKNVNLARSSLSDEFLALSEGAINGLKPPPPASTPTAKDPAEIATPTTAIPAEPKK
ncbi:MAG: DUF4340 domain-containing protein [Bdellovibrionaceae bacterium]|nr:DUF4340 domain-containing protein [Pseudobdellovibrionaceae bacterium]